MSTDSEQTESNCCSLCC